MCHLAGLAWSLHMHLMHPKQGTLEINFSESLKVREWVMQDVKVEINVLSLKAIHAVNKLIQV